MNEDTTNAADLRDLDLATAVTTVGQRSASVPTSRKLTLRREVVQDLSEQMLSSQGHSLWTCDSALVAPNAPVEDKTVDAHWRQ